MNKLNFNFVVDKGNKTITVTKEFAADLSTAWDAFTKPEFLDLWWAPKPWVARTKTMEFREDGKRLYAMVGPEGEEHWAMFHYYKIEKQKYFTGRDGFTDAQGELNNEMPRSNWKISFTGKGATTLVEVLINYDTLDQLETIIQMGLKEGFTIALEGLDEILLSRSTQPGRDINH